IPVLPLVGSSRARPGSSSPAASAASIIPFAIRSLIEPVGFCPSSFAYSRTSPSGRSSTSGVLPIRSRRDGARALATSLPNVDRGAELPEQLVDAPQLAAAIRRDGGLAVGGDELGLAAAEPRQPEERLGRVPRAVLDHALAPLTAKLLDRDLRQAGVGGRRFDRVTCEAVRCDGRACNELGALARLEQLRRERDVGDD